MDFHCVCSGHPVKMTAIEYCRGNSLVPEIVIYECGLCGKRTFVFHKPNLLLVDTPGQPSQQ
jgi:hypothetical protein